MKVLLGLLPLVVLISCAPKEAAKASSTVTTQGATAADPKGALPTLKAATEAEDYSGLNFPRSIEFTLDHGGVLEAGTQTISLDSQVNGVRKYKIARTGSLAALGDEVVGSDSTGVYTLEVSLGKMNGRHLELPAKVAPGDKWVAIVDIPSGPSGKIYEKDAMEAKGIEKVKIGGMEYPALKVVGTGSMQINQTRSDSHYEFWYVKGYGAVKLVVQTKTGSATDVFTIAAKSLPN
jgi:hypothetical protein